MPNIIELTGIIRPKESNELKKQLNAVKKNASSIGNKQTAACFALMDAYAEMSTAIEEMQADFDAPVGDDFYSLLEFRIKLNEKFNTLLDKFSACQVYLTQMEEASRKISESTKAIKDTLYKDIEL